jgi:hypothetical protein
MGPKDPGGRPSGFRFSPRGRPNSTQASAAIGAISTKTTMSTTQADFGKLRTRALSEVSESKMAHSQKMSPATKNNPPSLTILRV